MAKILFLAPQPFYQERGTPIAIDLALQVLDGEGHEVDLVTYPEGEPRRYVHLTHHRLPRIPGVDKVPPGFSWKKLVYSAAMVPFCLRLARRRRYDLVHAVEEGVFIALLLKVTCGLPFVYDMDSSLANQLVEKKPWLRPLSRLFHGLEGLAIRRSAAVVAVCPALVAHADACGSPQTILLQDISLLDLFSPGRDITDLRRAMATTAPLILYVGNLEKYQGVELLLRGLAEARRTTSAAVAVIGGAPADVERHRRLAAKLGIAPDVRFFGPRPLRDLGAYLAQADIVVSPRTMGDNTPMKIYTYLHAGKPLLATRIESHTQVLDDDVACLVAPDPVGMAGGINLLAASPDLRQRLGRAGRRLAAEKHCWPAYQRILAGAYTRILSTID